MEIISMTLSPDEKDNIKESAKGIVEKYKDKPVLLLVGMFRRTEDDYPKDPTQTSPVASECSKCGKPVWSTILKEEVKKLEPLKAKLLCPVCLITKGATA